MDGAMASTEDWVLMKAMMSWLKRIEESTLQGESSVLPFGRAVNYTP